MEKIISLTDKQVEKIDSIDNFFAQKQNELRLAMEQTEKIYANVPNFFVPKAMGKNPSRLSSLRVRNLNFLQKNIRSRRKL